MCFYRNDAFSTGRLLISVLINLSAFYLLTYDKTGPKIKKKNFFRAKRGLMKGPF